MPIHQNGGYGACTSMHLSFTGFYRDWYLTFPIENPWIVTSAFKQKLIDGCLSVLTEVDGWLSQLSRIQHMLHEADGKMKRLQFHIAQLEGTEFKGHSQEQARRIASVCSFDHEKVSLNMGYD